MDFLFASFILSTLLLIVIIYLLNEYDIDLKSYIKIFIYLFSVNSIFIYYYNNNSTSKSNSVTAAAEVFNEINDSQQLNGIMPLNSMLGGNDELIIDNIPKSITCNNIV